MQQLDGNVPRPKKPIPEWLARWRATKRNFARSVVPRSHKRKSRTAADLVIAWYLPWEIKDYPGHRRGILQLLQNKVTWSAVKQWRYRGNWPVWALELLHEATQSRVNTARELLRELDAQLTEARHRPDLRTGFCIVRDDGRDRRGNWRR